MEQRPYQKKLISDARLAIRENLPSKSSLLLVMPTGAGKTVVFSAIAKAAVERGNNVLILVHRRELIRQASEKLSLINVDHGVIAAAFEQKENPMQIASVQTIIRRLEKICFIPDLIIAFLREEIETQNQIKSFLKNLPFFDLKDTRLF